MARIDVVKAKIDLLKTIIVTFVIGSLTALVVYNIQTSGTNIGVVMVAVVVIGIAGYVLSKPLNALFDELEGL